MAQASTPTFPGFPDFQANVTFTPRQFFTVVLPYNSPGVVRIVGYVLRKVLGWVDRNGNPTQTRLRLTYSDIVEHAGLSREDIAPALAEAIAKHFLKCVQEPKRDTKESRAQTGIYELCWDREGEYTDNPALFRGFIYREAIVVSEGKPGKPVLRATAARKNIPNAFFDHVLPNERLSVIRVVGALLYYSIQWGPAGERKVPVSRSIAELGRLTHRSRQRTHAAVLEAERQGYIETTDHGCFDPAGGRASRAATYAIRWVRTPQPRGSAPPDPVGKWIREDDHRATGVVQVPVGKRVRNRSEFGYGERSEIMNDITVKTFNTNTSKTTAPLSPGLASNGEAAAASAGFELLTKVGFDIPTAQQLAARHSLEVIQRQIDWLVLRSPSKSRLGLLRRAIEHDWPKPETGHPETPLRQQARTFASHYYAAYHGFQGPAGTEPLPKDLEMADRFIPRLLALRADDSRIAEWGKRFGQWVRKQHQNLARALPNLAFTLPVYGDGFLRILASEGAPQNQAALGRAQEAHQRAFAAAYTSYLAEREIALQQASPELYAAFALERAKFRETATQGTFQFPKTWLERFDRDESRLEALAEHFHQHPEFPIPSFWEWDATVNPRRFGTPKPTEVRA